MQIDRQIAVWGGWIAGPAFGVAMMAAPEYLHPNTSIAGAMFWGGIAVFFLTLVVVFALSAREQERRHQSMWPIVLMAIGVIVFGVGAAWYFWPTGAKLVRPPVEAYLSESLRLPMAYIAFGGINNFAKALEENKDKIPVQDTKLRADDTKIVVSLILRNTSDQPISGANLVIQSNQPFIPRTDVDKVKIFSDYEVNLDLPPLEPFEKFGTENLFSLEVPIQSDFTKLGITVFLKKDVFEAGVFIGAIKFFRDKNPPA